MTDFFDRFLGFAQHHYPHLYPALSQTPFGSNFISDVIVDITAGPVQVMTDAVNAIEAVYALPAYQADVLPPELRRDPGNRSVLMGYDFFITPEGPRLIEINTNAAASLVVALLNAFYGISPSFAQWEAALRKMFESEWVLSGQSRPLRVVAIVDESQRTQRTAFEFHLFRLLFRSWGWEAVIADMADLVWNGQRLLAAEDGPAIDMVYNRFCDFTLTSSAGQQLRRAWETGAICLTPHPRDYVLLADKSRLISLSDPAYLRQVGASESNIAAIERVLPPVRHVRTEDAAQLWARRKSLFFKPATGFGSKGVYKGERISKKVFDGILRGDYVAQPYFEAGTIPVDSDGAKMMFKYDIRLYAYRDTVLGMGARLFRGQALNFQTPGGGFAPVRITPLPR